MGRYVMSDKDRKDALNAFLVWSVVAICVVLFLCGLAFEVAKVFAVFKYLRS